MKEREVGRFRETRTENAVINHRKIERWNEEILAVNFVTNIIIIDGGCEFEVVVISDTEFDFSTHLCFLVLFLELVVLNF